MPQPRPRYTDGTTTVSTQLLAFNGGTLSIVSGVPTLTISGGGGGTSDHALLSHLSWSSSGHTGTASRVAGFDGTGAAAYLTGSTVVGYVATTAGDLVYGDGAGGATRLPIGSVNRLLSSSGTAPQWSTPSDVRALLDLEIGVDVQAYDAGLTSLTAADASAGLPYVTAANTWATATYSSMLSVVSGAWKVIGLRESGGTDLSIGAIGTGVLVGRGATAALGGVTVSSPLALSGGALSVGDASTSAKGVVQLAGDIAGTATSVTVTQARGLRETAGPTTLSMGAVSDGQYLKRSGSSIVGVTGPSAHASSHQDCGSDEIATATPAANAIPKADEWGSLSPWTLSPLTWVGWLARASGTSFQWLGDTGFATGGTATPGNTLTQTVWSISGAGSAASCRAANQDVRIGHSVISEGCFVTSSSLASIRIWAGMANALGTGATPTGDSAGLNFDPALSANAQVFAYDGTTISRTDTGVTIATNTVYRYQVYLTTAGVQARIWVAGSAVPAWVSHATNLPRASVNMWSGVLTLINTAAGTKSLGVVSVGARWRLNDA